MMRRELYKLWALLWPVLWYGSMLLMVVFGIMPDEFSSQARHSWLATPTATPAALALPEDASAARRTVYNWLYEKHGLRAAPDPTLEERAYLLAGESPRYRNTRDYVDSGWPVWPGYRYVVGSANGLWDEYWSGCPISGVYHYDGTLWWSDSRAPLANHTFPALSQAQRIGVGVATRESQQIVAIIWDWEGVCPTPAPITYGEDLPPSSPGH